MLGSDLTIPLWYRLAMLCSSAIFRLAARDILLIGLLKFILNNFLLLVLYNGAAVVCMC